jgi:hypothetical protein
MIFKVNCYLIFLHFVIILPFCNFKYVGVRQRLMLKTATWQYLPLSTITKSPYYLCKTQIG